MGWFDLSEVAWLGVAVATLAAFIVSYLWYHERGLGRAWSRASGVPLANLRAGLAPKAATQLVVLAVTAAVMCVLQAELLIVSVAGGLAFGAFVGLIFRLGWSFVHGAFEGRPAAITILDAGHDVVALAVIGAVVGAFL